MGYQALAIVNCFHKDCMIAIETYDGGRRCYAWVPGNGVVQVTVHP